MKRNRWFTAAGLFLFFLLCLVPSGQAQQATPISQAPGTPWQLGLSWTFNSASPSTGTFNVAGLSYYRVLFVPTGTVSGCGFSLDSAAALGGSFATGGILSAATIGSCAGAGMYVTTTAAGVTNWGRITPTITGSGSVTVVLFGYTDNPAAGGSIGGSVAVTNFPSTQVVTQPTGSNLHTVVDSGTITASNPSVGSTGSAVPASGTAFAGKNGSGNLQDVATDSSGNVGVNLQNAVPAGTNAIGNVNQTIGVAGFGKVTDGTNTAAVKAASTAVAAGDPSLAVGLSPNSPLPAGTNSIGGVTTQPTGFGSLVEFQQAVTASAAALPSNAAHSFCVKALPTNALTVYLGGSGVTTSTGYPLQPGDWFCYQLSNTNLVYVIASSTGSSVSITGN
jgi:hypothetical protein